MMEDSEVINLPTVMPGLPENGVRAEAQYPSLKFTGWEHSPGGRLVRHVQEKPLFVELFHNIHLIIPLLFSP